VQFLVLKKDSVVLKQCSPLLGHNSTHQEMALKVSGAFGGGMGHMGETCGAVTVRLCS